MRKSVNYLPLYKEVQTSEKLVFLFKLRYILGIVFRNTANKLHEVILFS